MGQKMDAFRKHLRRKIALRALTLLAALLLAGCRSGYVEVSDRNSNAGFGYESGGQGSAGSELDLPTDATLLSPDPTGPSGPSDPSATRPLETLSPSRSTAASAPTLPPATQIPPSTTAPSPATTARPAGTTLPPVVTTLPPVATTLPPTTTAAPRPGNLVLLEFTRTVKKGNKATLTIQGAPNTKYTIKVKYSSGYSTAKGLEPVISDSYGVCSWTWKVGGSTKPGDYPVTVSDGVNSYTLTLTVE